MSKFSAPPARARLSALALALLLGGLPPALLASPMPQAASPGHTLGPSASDDSKPAQLAPVTVQADALDAPPLHGTEVHIDAANLARHNITAVEDVLAYAPNLTIRKRYIGDTNAILGGRAAGTTQSARSLVYANGLLLSDLLGSSWANPPRWGMVSARDIQSIEILYGPFSARFPGNSLGTTVLLHTRLPDKPEAAASVQLFQQHFSDDWGSNMHLDGRRIDASLGSRHDRLRWRLSLSHLDSHGQPMGYASAKAGGDATSATPVSGLHADRQPDGRPRLLLGPTGMDHTRQNRAMLDMGLDLGTDLKARLLIGLWQNRSDQRGQSRLRDARDRPVTSGDILVDGTVWSIPGNAFAPSHGDATQRMLGLTLDGHMGRHWQWKASASRYDDLVSRNREADSLGSASGSLADNAGSGWRTWDVSASGELGQAHTLNLGLHRDHYRLRSRAYTSSDWRHGRSDALDKAYGGQTVTTAAYAEDLWSLDPAWLLTLGLRAEHWRASDGLLANADTRVRYPARSQTTLSPKAALAWYFAEGWQLRLSLGRAVRFPTVSELFQGTLSGQTIVHNDPDLRPETAWAGDLSLERHLAGGHWRLSLFDYRIHDTLFRQTDVTVTPNVTRVGNIDRVRMRGIELAAQWRDVGVRGLDIHGSVAWNDAVTLHDRAYPAADAKRFPRIPRVRAKLGASWRFAPAWTAYLDVRHSGRQYGQLDNSDTLDTFGAISRFTVIDTRLAWKPAPAWTLALGVNNLGDRHYWVYHPWPGRTFFASLDWRLP